jgi:hypothetical protein
MSEQETYERHRMGLKTPRVEDRMVNIQSPDAPPPGEESVGPTMFDMVVELRRAQEVSKFLLSQAENLLKRKTVVAKATDSTDATGALQMAIYQVPQGFQFYLTRWNVEGGAFTPGAPFSSATANIQIINGRNFGVGAIMDFLPNPPAANGNILPASNTDGLEAACLFRGGEWISLMIRSGPVSTAIIARIQGIQEVV